ncbi:MAG: TetR/AcrR family transcriptional regulator [Burkholderiales bacterium]
MKKSTLLATPIPQLPRPKAVLSSVPDRQTRRKMETHAKLLNAAYELSSMKGLENCSIQEITSRADVGFGSFYNYFASKQELLDAMIAEQITPFADALDRLDETLSDPAEIMSTSMRHVLSRAQKDRKWGWFLVRLGMLSLIAGFGPRLERDILRGVESGRFTVQDLQLTMLMLNGGGIAVMTKQLMSGIDKNVPERYATLVLVLLGVPLQEAAKIARKRLPPLKIAGVTGR